MTEQLVTIAAFNKLFEAQVARNYLDELGFETHLSNELLVAMDWAAGMAFGDVQLRVPSHEADRARKGLQQKEPLSTLPHAESLSSEGDEERNLEDEPIEISDGDALASRAVRAAILGPFVIPPLLNIYSFWVLMKLFAWDGELTPSATRKMRAALVIDCVVFALTLVLLEKWLILW